MQKAVAISRIWSYNYGVVEIDMMQTKTEQAIKAAYDAGVIAGKNIGITLGIEMGLKRAAHVASRDLNNFKFPGGQLPIGMPLAEHAPADDSTFEFTYERYEDRVKKKEAETAEARAARTFSGRRKSNRIMANNRRNRK